MMTFFVPFVPPTTNHAYFNGPHGRQLSAAGKKFKTEVTSYLARNYPSELRGLSVNLPYGFLACVSFERKDLYCKGYPESAESRYKKLDVTNRVKLIEDAFVEACAVDDKHFFISTVTKTCTETSGTTILIWNIESEGVWPDGVTNWIRSLPTI